MKNKRKKLGLWLDKYPWIPGVLTLGYVLFALAVVVLAVYIPSLGNDMPRFFNIVSGVLIIGPIILTVLQILNFRHTIASIPRLAFLYLEIILMFGVIYFYAVSAHNANDVKSVSPRKVIAGIDTTWAHHVKNIQFEDRNAIMKEALVCFQDCIHFSLITSTTVGYGNIVPVSPMAKLLVDIQVLVSFFLIAFGAGYIFSNKKTDEDSIDELKKRVKSLEENKD